MAPPHSDETETGDEDDHRPLVPASSSGYQAGAEMTAEERLVFRKLQEKARVSNFSIVSVRKRPGQTVVVCELARGNNNYLMDQSNSRQFTITSTIVGNQIIFATANCPVPELAQQPASLSRLLRYIDTRIEQQWAVARRVALDREIANEESLGTRSPSPVSSSGTTASRRSSRSTTPTVSDRVG